MESFLLDRLKSEVSLKYHQFGGLKGTGDVHFLADIYQRILDFLDDGKSAVSLMAIDFSKALNRMSHNVCVRNCQKEVRVRNP